MGERWWAAILDTDVEHLLCGTPRRNADKVRLSICETHATSSFRVSMGMHTLPHFSRRLSLAGRRLYHGILLFTWCGTCTLMSCVRNSTQLGKSQWTVPCSCA